MSKAYKVIKRVLMFDRSNPKTGYTVVPVSYGLLTTDDVAEQIAAESSATPGDVKNVLDRYAYYVRQNLKKGYTIELMGFGRLSIHFVKYGMAKSEDQANASLIKGMVPKFTPSYTVVNGSRKYSLMPDKISLVRFNGTTATTGDSTSGGSPDETDAIL